MAASGGSQPAVSDATEKAAPAPASVSTTPLANPLNARAHLPMPWRLVGASFKSEEKGERGWAPGPMAEGYYYAQFDAAGIVWLHADVVDHYHCTLGKDGAFEATGRDGQKVEGRVDLAHGELIWQGKKYRVRTVKEIAAEKALEKPALPLSDPESPIRQPDKNTLLISLKSEQRGSAELNFAMGGLRAAYLGHQGGWAVLRVFTNIELGEGEMLYRLPIADGTATIQTKNGGFPTYSFDVKKGKQIWAGLINRGNTIGWTGKKEDFEHPSNNTHWIVKPDGTSNTVVHTTDTQTGTGAEVRPRTRVRVRIWFYTDEDYLALRPDPRQGEEIAFTVGAWKDETIKAYCTDGVETAMDGVVRGMRAGGWRRAAINQVAAQALEKLIPHVKAGEVLHLEVNLVDVERGRE
jgi:hypothetical protein